MITTLFAPLGMANTRWKHTDLSPQNAKATQYTMDQNNEALEVPEYSYPTFYDGDLNTSAHDLARFMLAISAGGELNNSRILSVSSIGEMLSNQTGLDDFASERQGLFWFRSGAFIGHTGGDPGTSATMQYNPTTQTGIVFMMNIEDDHLGKEELGERLSPLISALYQFGVSQ
jgi:CubicO group peptidase (beta-lactamase class C family)